MLNAEATTERQGWAHFSTTSRAGKCLADTVAYFSVLFGVTFIDGPIIIIYMCDEWF